MNPNAHGNRNVFILLVMLVVITIRCTVGPFGGSEVKNERVYVFMPDGVTPAADVQVSVVPVDYLPGEDVRDVYTTFTNSEGWYTLRDVQPGVYNVLAEKDSMVCILDAVSLGDDRSLSDDTLEYAGTLSFFVKVQPLHNPQIVTAQVVGTPFYQNPDAYGLCVFTSLPAGSQIVRLTTENELYTPALSMVAVQPLYNNYESLSDSGSKAIADSTMKMYADLNPVTVIELPYAGIPVPPGVGAVFDPVSERVTVTWNTVHFGAFNDYVIYRDYTTAAEQSAVVVGSTVDNSFTDMLSDLQTDVERILELRYRVAVRDTNLAVGETFGFTSVIVKLSPFIE